MIMALTPEQQAYMRQKVLGYEIFHGKKTWAFASKWEADYLEQPTNPNFKKYQKNIVILFSKYGDQQILFAEYANRVTSKGVGKKVCHMCFLSDTHSAVSCPRPLSVVWW